MDFNVSRQDSDDYSVVVKNKGSDSNPWKWAIYVAGRKSPMTSSSESFDTMAGAYKAGKKALKKLLEKPHA